MGISVYGGAKQYITEVIYLGRQETNSTAMG